MDVTSRVHRATDGLRPSGHGRRFGQAGERDLASVKNMQILNLRSTVDVQTGESFTVTVDVSNGATTRVDEDSCGGAANACSSRLCIGRTCINTIFEFDGEQIVNGPFCLCGTEFGANTREFSATFVAPPTPGTYELSATLELPGSGSTAGPLTNQVTVTGEDPIDPPDQPGDPNGNNGNNGNGPILPCWLDPNRSCATPELMAWLLVIGAGVGLFVLD